MEAAGGTTATRQGCLNSPPAPLLPPPAAPPPARVNEEARDHGGTAHVGKASDSVLIDAAKVLQLQGRARQAALRQPHADASTQLQRLECSTTARRAHVWAVHKTGREPAANTAACVVLSAAHGGPAEPQVPPRSPAPTSCSRQEREEDGLPNERQAAFSAFKEQRRRRAAAATLIQASFR